MDGGSYSQGTLIDRCNALEASYLKLKEQFQVVLREKRCKVSANEEKDVQPSDSDSDLSSLPRWGDLPGSFFLGNPYRNVLEFMGHAIHVSRTGSWEITYWNRAAEKLYGYKDYEALGQRTIHLLFDEEHLHSALAIMQSLSSGRCWLGQLCLRKRSGQSFMALVTKSPLYEDGELTGIVTVSSDAAVFNNTNSGNMWTNRDNAYEQSKLSKINFRKIHWHPQPQIAVLPQLASSVSNLASKALSRKCGGVTGDTWKTSVCEEVEVESHIVKAADRPPKVPGVKFLQKLRIGVIGNLEKNGDENMHQNSSEDSSSRKEASNVTYSPRVSTSHISNLEKSCKGVPACTSQGFCEVHRPAAQLPRSSLQSDGSKFLANVPSIKSVSVEDVSPRQLGYHKNSNSGVSFGGGIGSLSSKGENDSTMKSDIRWDDLHLREKVGHGNSKIWTHFIATIKVLH